MTDTVVVDLPKETVEAWEFAVRIGERSCRVSVQKDYWRTLTGEKVSACELVFRSMLFLLEREPKGSILARFDVSDISTYFPEYEDAAREWSGRGGVI